MKTTNASATDRKLVYASPYDVQSQAEPSNPIVRAGMSLVETVMWLVLMALLSFGMLALLWSVSR